jgi:hypothetical protein
MDLKRKTQLRNFLTAYRNDMCEEAEEEARKWLINKCDTCNFSTSSGCMMDIINLRIENELWEG